MTTLTLERPVGTTAVDTGIIDCDVHPKVRSLADLRPYLSERWWQHLQTYGLRARHGFARGMPFPKATPMACRRDAWPASGGEPGSDLALMREQLLDRYDVRLGILNPLTPTGQGALNPELSAAMCRATNHWQIDALVEREPRLKASIVVPYEDGALARAEIEHWAGHPGFAQVLLLSRTAEPLGQRRYWPIYEAAAAAGLPVGIHVFGYSGWPTTGSGWPSFYIEEMTEHAASCQAGINSLIFEGVLERLPDLKIVVIEAGFAWLPALAWRLDRVWQRNRSEVPSIERPPSEQIRQQVWLTSQPMEEPEIRSHLADVVDWLGADRIMFASDYPHWDFDDPHEALKGIRDPEIRQKIRFDNAATLFAVRS
jgi:predicted TIM-barrel fold metal-dependent hydrolase